MTRQYKLFLVLFIIIILMLTGEIIRDVQRSGDFRGYALAGNWVLNGEDIYTNPKINTWPPFFSLVCVPIALVDNYSKILIRLVWLIGTVLAMTTCINLTTQMTIKRKLRIFPLKSNSTQSSDTIHILHPIVFIPLLIILRYVLENLSNIQINIYMLLLALSSLYSFSKNREIPASMLLALSLSMKVYTIFLLFYFIIKREYKMVGYTLLFTGLFCITPIFIFGWEQTLHYYTYWFQTNVGVFASVGHKNQSFFSMMRSLLMHESPGVNQPLNREFYINILDLSVHQVKLAAYGLLVLIGLPVAFLLRKKPNSRSGLKTFTEYALVMNAIPLLSPLSWKAYFIFLWPSWFVNYYMLFQTQNHPKPILHKWLKGVFYTSILLTVFSADGFVGRYFSDILELFSSITIGSILIFINLILFYKYYPFEHPESLQNAKQEIEP